MCVYIFYTAFIAVIYITVFLPSIKNIKANSQNKISAFQYEYLHRNRSRKYNNFMEMKTDRVTSWSKM